MRRTLVLAGAATTVGLMGLASAAPAFAAGSELVVTDRETVQAYLSPTGEVKVARLYDQITATGEGSLDIANPVSTDGLRNLDGLGGVEVRDGKAISRLSVSGEKRLRTVSSFDEDKLPVTVTPTYKLGGTVYDDPEDLVGKSGELTVSYRVENVTSERQTLTVKDGKGNDVQREVDVPLPLVGSLTTVLPKGFYSVRSDQATISADGRGGTRMTFTMTLLPPIGSAVAEFGYTAQVSDAMIPKATVSVAVVQPLKYPSLKTAADSYAGGTETGATLTAGAEEIDSNLLKLRDGAGQLLGGLIQLRDGAAQLNDGLAGEAAPGAHELADGAGKAAVGASELATGLGKIAKGNKDLAAGFNSPTGDTDLVSGSQDLASGLGLISGGLSQLAGVEGLPQAQASTLALRAGVDKILAGLGSPTTSGTILNGLAQLSAGNGAMSSGLTSVKGGLDTVAAGLPVAKGGVDAVRQGMIDGGPTTASTITAIGTAIATAAADPGCTGTCATQLATASATLTALGSALSTSSATAVGALGQVSTGLGSAITGLGDSGTSGTIRWGVAQVLGGLSQSATGLSQLTAGINSVKLGLSNTACNTAKPTDPANPCGVREGLTLLSNGLLSAVSGVTQLSAGADTAAEGAGDLAAGIATAGDGAKQLAEGSADAAAGSRALADGNGKIATGAGDLAAGLDTAADGSGKIADGLEEAAGGAPALVDGAERLSTEGTKKLVEAGNETTVEFGEKYAVLEAMAVRTEDGGLPYGAPDGATGSAAYSLELAAATHEGSKNLTRGVLAIGALGLGALVSQLVRTRFS